VAHAVGERPAQLRPGFEQRADGLADLIALARSPLRKSCSHARTSGVMTRA
jgi:hypothetical protein